MSDEEGQNREKEIFFKALDLEPGAERDAFLEEACEGDEDLRRAVDGLIASHDAPDSMLEAMDGHVGRVKVRAADEEVVRPVQGERWKKGDTPWDHGRHAPPFEEFVERIGAPSGNVLIPGPGSGHSGEGSQFAGASSVALAPCRATSTARFQA